MLDKAVLWQLSYGVYAIGVKDGERPGGCIANTVFQITSSPAIIGLSMNKDNYTHGLISKEGEFVVSVLSEETNPLVISYLGFRSGRDMNKFEKLEYEKDGAGHPIITDHICGYMRAKVVSTADTPTHTLFLAEVVEAVKVSDLQPMTYEYYHKVIKGNAPKNAPTYQQKGT